MMTQVASALSYLHALSIIHGDVKASNILINNEGEASISDFGLARILNASGFTTKSASGTWRYTAPVEICTELVELCTEEEYNPSTTQEWRWKAPELLAVCLNEEEDSIPRLTAATDVYAFAMTVIEIFTQSIPFSQIKRDASVIHFVMSGGRPKREHCRQINDEIWMMLERCWDADPNQRPSMAALHTFFCLEGNLSSRATCSVLTRTRSNASLIE